MLCYSHVTSSFLFFNHTPPPQIYPLSLHDALPIYHQLELLLQGDRQAETHRLRRVREEDRHHHDEGGAEEGSEDRAEAAFIVMRSEEHTSELQSLAYLVCRLLLEKKKKNKKYNTTP